MRLTGLASFACAAALTVACSGDTRTDDTTVLNDNDAAIGTTGETDAARVGGDHADFIHELMATGQAEIQLGKLAAERGSSAEVKQYGQMMVQDHTRSGEELKKIASQYNLSMPAAGTHDDEHSDLIERLSKLSGAEFDREYIDAMVDSHQDVIDQLESRVDARADDAQPRGTSGGAVPEEADSQIEASVNGWAAKTLPAVQGHLEKARALDEKLDRRSNTAAR